MSILELKTLEVLKSKMTVYKKTEERTLSGLYPGKDKNLADSSIK